MAVIYFDNRRNRVFLRTSRAGPRDVHSLPENVSLSILLIDNPRQTGEYNRASTLFHRSEQEEIPTIPTSEQSTIHFPKNEKEKGKESEKTTSRRIDPPLFNFSIKKEYRQKKNGKSGVTFSEIGAKTREPARHGVTYYYESP